MPEAIHLLITEKRVNKKASRSQSHNRIQSNSAPKIKRSCSTTIVLSNSVWSNCTCRRATTDGEDPLYLRRSWYVRVNDEGGKPGLQYIFLVTLPRSSPCVAVTSLCFVFPSVRVSLFLPLLAISPLVKTQNWWEPRV